MMQDTARIILQDRKSRRYFKKLGEWTAEIQEANDFKEVISALEFAHRIGHRELDILMTFGEPRYDVRITATP